MFHALITGIGSYAPERVLDNVELERLVETTDAWIMTRTGIKERRIAAPDQATSDLGFIAATRALEMAGVTPAELDLILVATCTPDHVFPATACTLQSKLGATRAAAFDFTAACSGFLYGLTIAQQFVATGRYQRILLVGAEKISSITDWTDRNTCVLFGDGAGAVVIEASKTKNSVVATSLGSNGDYGDLLLMPAGGSRCPASAETVAKHDHSIRMSGREVFKLAVTIMQNSAENILAESGLSIDDIACIVPHQANMRIVEAIADRLKVGLDRFFINLHKYGNTSAASIPLALDEAVREGRVKDGDKVLLVAFGGGLTWASAILEWHAPGTVQP